VSNCQKGGGLAAILYNREGESECKALTGASLAAAGIREALG
jgi:hypothetical protein